MGSGADELMGEDNNIGGQTTDVLCKDSQKSDHGDERAFGLEQLIQLQVSITGSLKLARQEFEDADSDLVDEITELFQMAHDTQRQAVWTVSRYAQVAQRVRQFVLPDVEVAVQEKEPTLAMDLMQV